MREMSDESAARELKMTPGAESVPPQRERRDALARPGAGGAYRRVHVHPGHQHRQRRHSYDHDRVQRRQTDAVQWVYTVYMLALGVVVPFSGWLGDRIGFKRLYIAVHGRVRRRVAALQPCMEHQLPDLRPRLQAVGGGMIMPTTMAMVFRMVPKTQFGSAMGIFGIALLVAPAIGPTLGGYLVEYVDWRWIFTINLPVGVIGILLSLFVLPEFQSKHPGKLDIARGLTSAGGLFCLLLALTKGAGLGLGRGADGPPVRHQLLCSSCCSFTSSSRRRTRSWTCGYSSTVPSPWRTSWLS